MERKLFIEDDVLALLKYTKDDDMDLYKCRLDIETQRAFNTKIPKEHNMMEQFPFTQKVWDNPFSAVIVDKKSNKIIGSVIFSLPPYDDDNSLAIYIYNPYRKMGYGARAFYLGAKYCFEQIGVNIVGSSCYENNIASQKMHDKLGFIRLDEKDSHEICDFTGKPIIQYEYYVTKSMLRYTP